MNSVVANISNIAMKISKTSRNISNIAHNTDDVDCKIFSVAHGLYGFRHAGMKHGTIFPKSLAIFQMLRAKSEVLHTKFLSLLATLLRLRTIFALYGKVITFLVVRMQICQICTAKPCKKACGIGLHSE